VNRSIRVITVDDQPLFREAARAAIGRTPGFELVGESGDGESALGLARSADPDMVILDVRMDGMDGIETARRLIEEDPTRVVVLVSSADLRGLSGLAEQAGAAALVDKRWLTPRLLQGLWAAHRRR
jgi:two-component system, LytTR family, response regulator AlgR